MKKILVFAITSLLMFSINSCDSAGENKSTIKEASDKNEHIGPQDYFPTPEKAVTQEDVIELVADPIDTVRIAFIGLGMRGSSSVRRYTYQENVKIVALCDVRPEKIKESQETLKKRGLPEAEEHSGKEDWKKLCERDDIDLIYVCTQWDLHTPIAVYAMEHGKHVALEVPAAITVDECWQLVNTAEKTRKHCIQLENCMYDFFEMATLNMAQQGLFGEIVHGEGAYIHDLRDLNFDDTTGYWNTWRLGHLEKFDGNTYPTHGLGPIAHAMNIHRGDKFDYLVSVSTNEFGLTKYAEDYHGKDSEFSKKNYKKGDMNTSVLRTAKGKTIMIQHDVTSPRPYSRLHTLSGTKGFAQKYPTKGIALSPHSHHFMNEKELDSILTLYEHPIVTAFKEKALEVGGHGGMDFIMDSRLIYCLRNGLPLDQDVYDAAEWSSIVEISRVSVENGSIPVKIPDFTRGAWQKKNKVTYYTKETN